jgi:hypothetical protein
MYIDNIEAAYLVGRIRASADMAEAAVGRCAKQAHEELASRYKARLVALLRVGTIGASAPMPSVRHAQMAS